MAMQMWHTHTINQYSTIKRNEVLVHATTGINLENIKLSKKKPVTDHILHDSTHIKCPEQKYL